MEKVKKVIAGVAALFAVLVIAGFFLEETAPKEAFGRTSYKAGTCVTFDDHTTPGSDLDSNEIEEVACTETHVAEIVGHTDLDDTGAYPSQTELEEQISQKCTPIAEKYLGYPVQPFGRFVVLALFPQSEQFDAGDRLLNCTLQVRTLGDANPDDWEPFAGPVKGQNQELLYGAGTCVAAGPNDTFGLPASCDGPHRFEIVGRVDLPAESTQPSTADIDDRVGQTCTRVTREYVGGPPPADARVFYVDLSAEQWAGGMRTYECAVARVRGETAVDSSGSIKSAA